MTGRLGVDVSSDQHPGGRFIDWPTVASDGVAWAAIKCSEGAAYANPFDTADVTGAGKVGIEIVEYHFARPATNAPSVESDWCVRCRGPVVPNRRYALDLEDGLAELGAETLAEWCKEFIAQTALNLIYANGSYRDALAPYGFPWRLGEWLADPSGTQRRGGEAVIQIGQGSIAGIPATVDLNAVFYPIPA